jgi:hypothetical protein
MNGIPSDYKWLAPPRTPAELAERDRVLKGRISISEATVSVNVGFGPDIPIFQPRISRSTEMTTAEKISVLRNLAPPHTRVNAQSAAHSSTFDPRATFSNKSINVVYPSRDDFSDDRVNTDDDAEAGSSSLGVAHDLIGCVLAGEDGTQSCVHEGDHVALAKECLERYSRDEAMRKQHRADAGRQHSVRFV